MRHSFAPSPVSPENEKTRTSSGPSVSAIAAVAARRAYASSASSTLPFVSIPTKWTVSAAISGTMPIR